MKTVEMPTVVVDDKPPSVSEEDISCEHCGKDLETEEQRSEHMMTCTGAMDDKNGGGHFACDVCAKPFKRKEHLFQHRKLHTGMIIGARRPCLMSSKYSKRQLGKA